MNLLIRSVFLIVVIFLCGLGAWRFWPQAPLVRNVTADKVLVQKGKRQLHLLKDGVILKSYRIALGGNPRGDKTRRGDERTPEGVYTIDWRNPRSKYHLSLHISYPDSKDRMQAKRKEVSPGGDIMIHGTPNGLGWIGSIHNLVNWTNGCIAVSDHEIEEIWRAVPNGTVIELLP